MYVWVYLCISALICLAMVRGRDVTIIAAFRKINQRIICETRAMHEVVFWSRAMSAKLAYS